MTTQEKTQPQAIALRPRKEVPTRWTYTARQGGKAGKMFEHIGSFEGTLRRANRYARVTFPAWLRTRENPVELVIKDVRTGEQRVIRL